MSEPITQMPDNEPLRDSEVALMDAIKAVLEVIIAKEISTPETLAEVFARLSQKYPQQEMPRAVYVMESLVEFLNDPRRKELRSLYRNHLRVRREDQE